MRYSSTTHPSLPQGFTDILSSKTEGLSDALRHLQNGQHIAVISVKQDHHHSIDSMTICTGNSEGAGWLNQLLYGTQEEQTVSTLFTGTHYIRVNGPLNPECSKLSLAGETIPFTTREVNPDTDFRIEIMDLSPRDVKKEQQSVFPGLSGASGHMGKLPLKLNGNGFSLDDSDDQSPPRRPGMSMDVDKTLTELALFFQISSSAVELPFTVSVEDHVFYYIDISNTVRWFMVSAEMLANAQAAWFSENCPLSKSWFGNSYTFIHREEAEELTQFYLSSYSDVPGVIKFPKGKGGTGPAVSGSASSKGKSSGKSHLSSGSGYKHGSASGGGAGGGGGGGDGSRECVFCDNCTRYIPIALFGNHSPCKTNPSPQLTRRRSSSPEATEYDSDSSIASSDSSINIDADEFETSPQTVDGNELSSSVSKMKLTETVTRAYQQILTKLSTMIIPPEKRWLFFLELNPYLADKGYISFSEYFELVSGSEPVHEVLSKLQQVLQKKISKENPELASKTIIALATEAVAKVFGEGEEISFSTMVDSLKDQQVLRKRKTLTVEELIRYCTQLSELFFAGDPAADTIVEVKIKNSPGKFICLVYDALRPLGLENQGKIRKSVEKIIRGSIVETATRVIDQKRLAEEAGIDQGLFMLMLLSPYFHNKTGRSKYEYEVLLKQAAAKRLKAMWALGDAHMQDAIAHLVLDWFKEDIQVGAQPVHQQAIPQAQAQPLGQPSMHKKPVIKERTLSITDLAKITQFLRENHVPNTCFFDLGILLRMSHNELDTIRSDRSDANSRMRETLAQWLMGHPESSTWSFLGEALGNIGYKAAADELRIKATKFTSDDPSVIINVRESDFSAVNAYDLGLFLGIPCSTLDVLQSNNRRDCAGFLTAVIHKWLTSSEDANLYDLINAMKKTGNNSAADRLRRAYLP